MSLGRKRSTPASSALAAAPGAPPAAPAGAGLDGRRERCGAHPREEQRGAALVGEDHVALPQALDHRIERAGVGAGLALGGEREDHARELVAVALRERALIAQALAEL